MHTFQAMNSSFATLGLSRVAQDKAESWFAFVERNLSRFSPRSELSSLNRSAGRPFMASALLYQSVAAAHRYYLETEGVFHPYLGEELAELGYDASFETLAARQEADRGQKASEGEAADQAAVRSPASGTRSGERFERTRFGGEEGRLAARSPHGGDSPVRLDDRMMSITLAPGASVDLGGFAKGWSADQLSGMLRKDGFLAGAIDAGGDIAMWGAPAEGWELGVASPFAPGTDLLTLRVRGGAGIATSSRMKRRWADAAGTERHHLLDARTGRPAETDLVQVTVLAPRLTEAEVYAKCLLILGAEVGIPWLRDHHPRCSYVAVRADGSLLIDPDLGEDGDKGGKWYATAI